MEENPRNLRTEEKYKRAKISEMFMVLERREEEAMDISAS